MPTEIRPWLNRSHNNGNLDENNQNAKQGNYKDMHNISRGGCRIDMMDLCHMCRGMRLTLIKIIGISV